ncbi:hypothetical protein GOP47_0019596 [Adiantum capillus-veneris]|uniref:Remorin C-terminal domain-containing protein n=1 Tax=Adiantum capillus-veneris TaxID=13818 RepID=A0A9D4Z9R9_ADICA|nr:hypothetical protein GOP47_0019596 [Adiantum capillus-veneris]
MVVGSVPGFHSKKGEALARVNRDKTEAYIKAWEATQKANSNNRFEKALAKIQAWETSKQASVEASMRHSEQNLEKRRASTLESKRNEIANIRRLALGKRARAQARRQQEFVGIEEESRRSLLEGRSPKTCYMPCFDM